MINEGAKYCDPSQSRESETVDPNQDKKIFENARLINCAQFRNIVMEDFLKGLLGIPLVGPSANFDVLAVSEIICAMSLITK